MSSLRFIDFLVSVLRNIVDFQGVGGSVQYPKQFLKKAYEAVHEKGGVCIADEVCQILPTLVVIIMHLYL